MTKNTTPVSAGYCRAAELPVRFPVLSRGSWISILARGELRSTKIGRARIIKLSDVEAFLDGGVVDAQVAR